MNKQNTKDFYNNDLATALENCQSEGYEAMFMPELADARIQGKAAWDNWYSTPSMRATGKTKHGSKVVVYKHLPNYFSNPANIRKAIELGLIDGAGRMPQEEFQKIVDEEDNKRVFVVNHNKLRNLESVSVDSALEHPQTIPFLGGQTRAEKYLAKYKKAHNTNKIGIWYRDDLNENSPMGRLLFAGHGGHGDFDGNGDFRISLGHFFGVREDLYVKAFKTLTAHPEELTPEMATGLLELITAYNSKAKQ